MAYSNDEFAYGIFAPELSHADELKKERITQSDGTTTAKSPMEMFEPVIENDLKAVDGIIREYYGLEKAVKEKE